MSTQANDQSSPSARAMQSDPATGGPRPFGLRGEVRDDFGRETAWVLCEVPVPALINRIVLYNDDSGGCCAYYVRHDDSAFGEIWDRLRFRVGQRADGLDVYAMHELAPVQARLPLTQRHDAIIEAYVDPQQRIHRQMRFTPPEASACEAVPPRTYVSAARPRHSPQAPCGSGAAASLIARTPEPFVGPRSSVYPAPPFGTTFNSAGGPRDTLRPRHGAEALITASEALEQEGYFDN